jgi:hypothetical protein
LRTGTRRHRRAIVLCSGLLMLVGMRGETDSHSVEAAHTPGQTANVCHGFVVLPTGFVVLSGIPAVPERALARAMPDQAPAENAMREQGAPHPTQSPQASAVLAHLMDYQHGQDIAPQEKMFCVAIGAQEAVTWAGVSPDPALVTRAASLRGTLTSRSHTNAALAVTVSRGSGGPMVQAQVRLLVRMPHHDHRLPGGHGPANDPEVHGLVAHPDGPGRYIVPNVDFTMAGLWLVEIQVYEGTRMSKAYFGVAVGEESLVP